MPTSRQKREQHATRCDASRGQQVMDRLVRVVQREQRLQATSGEQNANFNSQPTPGWRREWKTAAAQNGSLMGPDLSWADDQSWLQGSKACFDVQSSRKAAGYPSRLFLLEQLCRFRCQLLSLLRWLLKHLERTIVVVVAGTRPCFHHCSYCRRFARVVDN